MIVSAGRGIRGSAGASPDSSVPQYRAAEID